MNVYSVRRVVVYIRFCENSCQSQTVCKLHTMYFLQIGRHYISSSLALFSTTVTVTFCVQCTETLSDSSTVRFRLCALNCTPETDVEQFGVCDTFIKRKQETLQLSMRVACKNYL